MSFHVTIGSSAAHVSCNMLTSIGLYGTLESTVRVATIPSYSRKCNTSSLIVGGIVAHTSST